MMVFRWVAVRFPDPEISFPPDTEMTLTVTSIGEDAPKLPLSEDAGEPSSLAPALTGIPYQTFRANGKPADDVINVAFVGSREQMIASFAAAGWYQPERLTKSSLARMYKAYIAMRGYPRAPVSRLLYRGRDPDLVFEKMLNNVEQRHHIRIWRLEDRDVWLGAGTHDIGVVFDPRHSGLTHKIDRSIDRERSKVVRDLSIAGCTDRSSAVSRQLPQLNVQTDGDIAVVQLRPCDGLVAVEGTAPQQPGTRVSRFARRLVLETRHYLLRDNAYHDGFQVFLAARRFMIERSNRAKEAKEAARQPRPASDTSPKPGA